MKEKNITPKIVIFGLVIATFILFGVTLAMRGQIFQSIATGIIALILIIFAIPVLKRGYESIKKGHPMEDEMSSKIKVKAGYLAFLVSIYYILGIMWYLGYAPEKGWPMLIPRHVAAISIVGMAIIFGLCYLYVSRKGV